MNNQGTEFERAKIELPTSPIPAVFPDTILKEIRSWAITLLVLGALHIFASGFFSAPWGVLLIAVGLASFYVRSSAMLVVYAVTLAWAGISNLISGEGAWIGFAVFQFFLVFRVFQKFRSFQQAETSLIGEGSSSSGLTTMRSARIFPWAAATLGVLSILGLVGSFVLAIFFVIVSGDQAIPQFLLFIEGLAMNAGVLGFAVGLASFLCRHPRKVLAITGMITGAVTLLAEILLLFI